MEAEIIELSHLSGNKCRIYSVIINNEDRDSFTRFVMDNLDKHKKEVLNIIGKLKSIGNSTGAIKSFFKDKEGRPGDGLMALYDEPGSYLRVYCINYGKQTILLGGGGPKSKEIRAYQEDTALFGKVKELQKIEKLIRFALQAGDLVLEENGTISGNLKLNNYEDD